MRVQYYNIMLCIKFINNKKKIVITAARQCGLEF